MDEPYRRRLAINGMSEGEDRLLSMVLALTSEMAVMRERIDTLERLLAQAGTLAGDAVETFHPDEVAAAARDAMRQRLIAKVMKPVRDAAARDRAEAMPGETDPD